MEVSILHTTHLMNEGEECMRMHLPHSTSSSIGNYFMYIHICKQNRNINSINTEMTPLRLLLNQHCYHFFITKHDCPTPIPSRYQSYTIENIQYKLYFIKTSFRLVLVCNFKFIHNLILTISKRCKKFSFSKFGHCQFSTQ